MALLGMALCGVGSAHAQPVRVWLRAPAARRVMVCGSFFDWRCRTLKRGRHGVYAGILSLAPGLYTYGFRVDGRWRLAHHALRVADGFGGHSDLLVVPVTGQAPPPS